MENQLRNHVRLALVKLREYNSLGEQQEQQLRKILSPGESIDLTIAKLLQYEPRNDYQLLIIMTFLSEFVGVLQSTSQQQQTNSTLQNRLDSLLFEHLWQLLQREPTNRQIISFYHLKKMEILKLLLVYKLVGQCTLPTYERLYRQLKSCQEATTNINREHFKVTFVSTHRSIIDHCRNELLMEFVVGELFEDSLKGLQESTKGGFEWLRTVDTRFLALQHLVTHRKLQPLLLYKIVFLVVKASAVKNIYVHVLSLGIFEALVAMLESTTRSPLLYILITHMLTNPLAQQLSQPEDIMFVELLLSQVMLLFRNRKLLFGVLRAADTNFHSKGIIYELVSSLYDYVEAEQKKPVRSPIYELIKKTVKTIMDSVRELLEKRKETDKTVSQQLESKLRFYRLKQKQYQSTVSSFNQCKKPIELAGNGTSDYQMEHFVRFLKRSPHINAQRMTEVMGLNTPISKSLLKKYIESFKLQGYPVEQALRIVFSNFFLIGESQQINRVLEELTLQISQASKSRDWDSIYLQATTILMLNTDLHNPMNERKMSEQDWLKIALNVKGVSEAEAKQIYGNVLHKKIECFRDYGNLHSMNLTCFLYNFYTDSRCWTLNYIDPELKEFEEVPELTRYLCYEVLEGVLVGKEVDKILKLIDVFAYKDDVYECEILESLRVLVERGKHDTPANIYEVASKKVNFVNDEIDEKYLSYYWLCAKILGQQYRHIPVELACDFLLATCKTRKHLEDDLYCRTQLKVRRVKEALKEHKSRLIKKTGSILDIFSNFLGDKESSEDEFKPTRNSEPKKSATFRKLALEIHDQLIANHEMRTRCIAHLMGYIRNPNNKMPVENFITVLYLLFDVVYLSSDVRCLQQTAPLFDQILQEGPSSLSERLSQLKKKKQKKYTLIFTLTQYYLLRILLEYFTAAADYRQLAQCAVQFVDKCSSTLLQEIVAALEGIRELASSDQSFFLREVDRAVIKGCRQNSITEGSVRSYAVSVLARQDCKAVVDHIIDKVGDRLAAEEAAKLLKLAERPKDNIEKLEQVAKEKPISTVEVEQTQERVAIVEDSQIAPTIQESAAHPTVEPVVAADQPALPSLVEPNLKPQPLPEREPEPASEPEQIRQGELIENTQSKSGLEKMEERLKSEVVQPSQIQPEPSSPLRLQKQTKESSLEEPRIKKELPVETSTTQQSPQQPVPAEPEIAVSNDFIERHPTQEEILQIEREYFAKLIGEHGEENLSGLGLPLYML